MGAVSLEPASGLNRGSRAREKQLANTMPYLAEPGLLDQTLKPEAGGVAKPLSADCTAGANASRLLS